MWAFISFLIFGLVAGAIARIIIPGKQPGGFWVTLLLGVVGAMLGGWLGSLLFSIDFESWSWWGLLFAVIGAVIVILIAQAIFGRRKTA